MKKILPFVCYIFLSCNNGTTINTLIAGNDSSVTENAFFYTLDKPAKIYMLPSELTEVSGITYLDKDNLGCVEDESGIVYIYDLAKSSVTHEVLFKAKGDFEGITYANGIVYTLQSNGRIYEISDLNASSVKEIKYNTDLEEAHDTEGLCFDRQNSRLLIACKDKGTNGKQDRKSIYAFDPANGNVSAMPVYHIDLNQVKDMLRKGHFKTSKIFKNPLDEVFMPSDIAIHPKTDEIYIISSKNRLLAVLDRQGHLNGLYQLSHEAFIQPEGITFDPKGDMYISNEGSFTKPTILKFTYEEN